jgi:hypothetical protein
MNDINVCCPRFFGEIPALQSEAVAREDPLAAGLIGLRAMHIKVSNADRCPARDGATA